MELNLRSAVRLWGRRDFRQAIVDALWDSQYELSDYFDSRLCTEGNIDDVTDFQVEGQPTEEDGVIRVRVRVEVDEWFSIYDPEHIVTNNVVGLMTLDIDRATGVGTIAGCYRTDDAEC